MNDVPELDIECEECHGSGEVWPDYYCPPRSVECARCDGKGRIPTEFGEKVLAFVVGRLKIRTTATD